MSSKPPAWCDFESRHASKFRYLQQNSLCYIKGNYFGGTGNVWCKNSEFEPDIVPIDFLMLFSEGTGGNREFGSRNSKSWPDEVSGTYNNPLCRPGQSDIVARFFFQMVWYNSKCANLSANARTPRGSSFRKHCRTVIKGSERSGDGRSACDSSSVLDALRPR